MEQNYSYVVDQVSRWLSSYRSFSLDKLSSYQSNYIGLYITGGNMVAANCFFLQLGWRNPGIQVFWDIEPSFEPWFGTKTWSREICLGNMITSYDWEYVGIWHVMNQYLPTHEFEDMI